MRPRDDSSQTPGETRTLRGRVSETEVQGESAAEAASAWVPRAPTVPGYEVGGMLGSGGMGEVWEARQLAVDRSVAIKVLRQDRPASEATLARFRREMDLASSLSHPHLAQVFDGGDVGGHLFYSMELVDGGTGLAAFAEEQDLDVLSRVGLVRDVCAAIGYAHRQGVIHRDIKPSNVLVDRSGRPKVVDFGLAKSLVSERSIDVSVSGEIKGTPAYMSPEQARGERDLTAASDVFSLGCLLFRVMTGKLPWREDTGTLSILNQIQYAIPENPAALCEGVPADVKAVLEKAMEKSPAHRYPDAGAMADDLSAALEGRPISFRADAWSYVLSRWARRHRKILLGSVVPLIAASAVIGLLLGGVFLAKPDTANSPLRVEGLPERLTIAEGVDLNFIPVLRSDGVGVALLRDPVDIDAWQAASLTLPEGVSLAPKEAVRGLSWEQASWFCEWLNGRSDCEPDWAFRLPLVCEVEDGATDAVLSTEWAQRVDGEGLVWPYVVSHQGEALGLLDHEGKPRQDWVELPDTRWPGIAFRVVYAPTSSGQVADSVPQSEPVQRADTRVCLALPGREALAFRRVEPGRLETRGNDQVELTYAFWMGVTELTLGQWHALTGERREAGRSSLFPVAMETQAGSMSFCDLAQQRLGHLLPEGYVLRLPTSCEWELVCHEGVSDSFAPGIKVDSLRYANHASLLNMSPQLLPVGSRLPSTWGIFDLNGNLAERVYDHHTTIEDTGIRRFPEGVLVNQNPVRILEAPVHDEIRGGHWNSAQGGCGCRRRVQETRDTFSDRVGFRLAIAPVIESLNILRE